MLNLPLQRQYFLAPLVVALICILLAIFEPKSSYYLAYDRSLIHEFQWWRLLSGHFMHTNIIHLVLNIAGLAMVWALHGHYYQPRQFILVFLFLCLGTSLELYLFAPQMQWYVGLSGVLHGLFVLGAYFDIKHKLKTGWLLLIGVWVKVLHEQIYGASPDVAAMIAANVAIDAHLFGTISGTLIILYYFANTTIHNRQEKS